MYSWFYHTSPFCISFNEEHQLYYNTGGKKELVKSSISYQFQTNNEQVSKDTSKQTVLRVPSKS